MSKNQQLTEGMELIYIGKGFEGFKNNQPYMIFLGYDSAGFLNIWADYQGQKIYLSVDDVEIVK